MVGGSIHRQKASEQAKDTHTLKGQREDQVRKKKRKQESEGHSLSEKRRRGEKSGTERRE